MRFLFALAFLFIFFDDVSLGDEWEPMLIGGEYAGEGEFPEVVNIVSGNAMCTASLIGPRVLITAAHCTTQNGEVKPVSEGKNDTIVIINQARFRSTCTISPKYQTEDHDIAMCVLDSALELPFASLVKEGQGPKVGDQVTHVGFGCTNPNGQGGNDGRLKKGKAIVTALSSGRKHSWESRGDGLCFGDSGGPGYRFMATPRNNFHVVIGINSRANIRDYNYLIDTSSKASQDFIRSWSSANNVEICGMHYECIPGQRPEPPAPPPQDPSDC